MCRVCLCIHSDNPCLACATRLAPLQLAPRCCCLITVCLSAAQYEQIAVPAVMPLFFLLLLILTAAIQTVVQVTARFHSFRPFSVSLLNISLSAAVLWWWCCLQLIRKLPRPALIPYGRAFFALLLFRFVTSTTPSLSPVSRDRVSCTFSPRLAAATSR